MYALLRTPLRQRNLQLRKISGPPTDGVVAPRPASHTERIRHELRELGVSWIAMATTESYHLPKVIHENEHIGGVVYGFHRDGFVVLVATDRRVVFLDKKPLFTNEDEVNYHVVSGVNLSNAGIGMTVVLHTRVKDYSLVTFNRKCAEGFVEYIENRCLEHTEEEKAL